MIGGSINEIGYYSSLNQATPMYNQFIVTGVFQNMFGGDPGGNGKDILEFTPTSPVGNHSSVLPILQKCRIVSAGFKWLSSATVPVLNPSDNWQIYLYKMTNPLTGSTTADGNFTLVGDMIIRLTSADTGTTPAKFAAGLNLVLNAGDIIRIAGVETGTIGTTTDDAALSILFENL
jgi:hypothetical protein